MKITYPIYIPSRGRADLFQHTGHYLGLDGVSFRVVVEPQEEAAYVSRFGAEAVLTLPESDRGLAFARNWIKDHAAAEGHLRHWQLDDNIRGFWRRWNTSKIRCDAHLALGACELFTDRYVNVGISGLNYYMFAADKARFPPFTLNVHVYSCMLIRSDLPYRFRGLNEDVDFCLQILSSGTLCSILLNAFLAWKTRTMKTKGGMTASYFKGGRLKMARELERRWPGVVTTGRRFQRPQHIVKGAWRGFDTPLIPRPDLDLAALPAVDEFGARLVQLRPPKTDTLLPFVETWPAYREDPTP